MSKRSPQTNSGEPEAMLPIPDGGLGSGMPDWLRRPPAWRNAGTTPASPRKIPPPDTSPIDPRTILTIDDLPTWLQGIATATSGRRVGDVMEPSTNRDGDAPTVRVEPAPPSPVVEPKSTVVAPSPSGTVPPTLPESQTGDVALTRVRLSARPSPISAQRWAAISPTLALSAALLVALVVILLLALGNL